MSTQVLSWWGILGWMLLPWVLMLLSAVGCAHLVGGVRVVNRQKPAHRIREMVRALREWRALAAARWVVRREERRAQEARKMVLDRARGIVS